MPSTDFQCPDSGLCVVIETDVDDDFESHGDYEEDIANGSTITAIFMADPDDFGDDYQPSPEALDDTADWIRRASVLIGRRLADAEPLLRHTFGVRSGDLDPLYW